MKYCFISCIYFIAFIHIFSSCSDRKIRKEYKDSSVKIYDKENIINIEPLIYKIENHVLGFSDKKYELNQISTDDMLLKVVLKQRVIYNEYIADEYVIKETYITGGWEPPVTILGTLPVYIAFAIPMAVFGSLDEWINRFKDHHIGGDILYEKEIERIQKNKKATGKTKHFINNWENGNLLVRLNDQTFRFKSDNEGVLFIDMIDLFKKISSIPEHFEMQFIAKLDDAKTAINIVIDDYILYQLEQETADMSYGKPLLSPYGEPKVHLKYHKDFQLKNGDYDVLFINVTNNGKGDIFQLQANLKSNVDIFDGKILNIGRIAPGYTKSARLPFSIPKIAQSSEIQLLVNFTEENGYFPESIEKSIIISGDKPPLFEFGYYIVDDGTGNSIGNGDDRISKRESIDIHIDVKNIGEAIAENTKAWICSLTNPEGLKLNTKELLLGDIKNRDVVHGIFTITIQPSYANNNVELLFYIQDGAYNSLFKKNIILPLDKVITPKYFLNNSKFESNSQQ